MKKILLSAVLLCILIPNLQAAQVDDSTVRGNFWGEFIFNGNITKEGVGIHARIGSRANFSYERTIDDSTISDENDAAWIQEGFLGPLFRINVRDNIKITTSPQYRAQLWYADEKNHSRFVMHAIYWPSIFTFDFKKLQFIYTLTLWNTFEDQKQDLDDEFYIRNTFGVSIPVHKIISVDVEDELYLLCSANDSRNEEVFYRNAFRAGITIKPLDVLWVQVRYMHYYTLIENSSTRYAGINDHYINVGLLCNVDFSNMNKKVNTNEREPKKMQLEKMR